MMGGGQDNFVGLSLSFLHLLMGSGDWTQVDMVGLAILPACEFILTLSHRELRATTETLKCPWCLIKCVLKYRLGHGHHIAQLL